MIIPVGAFNAVFAAAAALILGVVHAAEYTEATIIAQIDAVLKQTFLALFA